MRLVAEGLRLLAATQTEWLTPLVLTHICEAALISDRLSDAVYWLTQLDAIDRSAYEWCSAEVFRVRGLLAKAQGNKDQAEQHLASALHLARQQDALLWELRLTMELCELWASRGRENDALIVLVAVYDRFEEGFESSDMLKAN